MSGAYTTLDESEEEALVPAEGPAGELSLELESPMEPDPEAGVIRLILPLRLQPSDTETSRRLPYAIDWAADCWQKHAAGLVCHRALI